MQARKRDGKQCFNKKVRVLEKQPRTHVTCCLGKELLSVIIWRCQPVSKWATLYAYNRKHLSNQAVSRLELVDSLKSVTDYLFICTSFLQGGEIT